mmetsp:Transcript_63227/g.173647  ORF Transcript_63227/g.173647 Transcript_63227/m.173647 type:complete len:301 (-) Transcript_63227:368-1270(-)
MEDVDSADLIEIAMEARDAAKQSANPDSPADPRQSEADVCAVGTPCAYEEALLKLLPLGEAPKSFLVDTLLKFAQDTNYMPTLAATAEELLRTAGADIDADGVTAALALLEPFADAEADAARAKLAALHKAGQQAHETLAKLEPIVQLEPQMGAQQEWAVLQGQCYSGERIGSFAYKLCPFDKLLQDGRSLGTYAGWATWTPTEGHEGERYYEYAMRFGNGEVCDGVGPRSATVLFACGEEEKMLSVSEPSTCTYEGVFSTPSACDPEALRRKDEGLQQMARAAGLPYEMGAEARAILEP